MCGIAGLFHFDPRHPAAEADVRAMCDVLVHRGPDDGGVHTDGPAGIGMRRLSIIDLAGGHQPIFNEDKSLAIVYNGEVYNFAELRKYCEAKGHRFTTNSDTETILHLYEEDGPDAVAKLNGMFAFAIWDGRKRELFLARDRFGVKPLYYYAGKDAFWFASEMKALLAGSPAPRALDPAALDQYLTFLWVPEPKTILKDVRKLPPASWMKVGAQGIQEHRYWRMSIAPERMAEQEAADALRETLQRAVVGQTIADVPVGAFLSGGLDSSAVVALMVRGGRKPHQVHAMGFAPEDQKAEGTPDDLPYARAIAQRFGLDYRETLLRPEMAGLLPTLIYYLDEPLADPAIIPAYLICQAARGQTKVLLSGMGADEVFGGYRRHTADRYVDLYRRIPGPLRKGVMTRLLRSLPARGSAISPVARRLGRVARASSLTTVERIVDLTSWVAEDQRHSLYRPEFAALLNGAHAGEAHERLLAEADLPDQLSRMLYADSMLYLPSHNLNYTDKMSMAASIEVRVPYLDNAVVDFASRLPSSLKVRGFTTKYILRKAMEGILPPEIIKRQKTGFAAPIRTWLTKDLVPLVDDVLAPSRVAARGLFSPQAVAATIEADRSGRADNSYLIWALLTLELWMVAYHVDAPSQVGAAA